ncbi:MAG: HAD family hydrolase [Desulfobacterales bacterium]|nr:MAG: HAD family hydrolase [Desulfobacterales bacterium]
MNKNFIEKYIVPLSPIPTDVRPGGKLNHPITCMLFDVYGTLFISDSGDIGVAKAKAHKHHHIQELLEKYHVKTTPEKLLEELYGRIEKTHEQLRNTGIDFPEVEIDKIWMDILKIKDRQVIQRFAIEFELVFNPVYPMPHLGDMLSALKQQRMLMGIISNAQFFTPRLFEWFLGSALEHLGVHPNLVILSYQLKHAKPSAMLFDLAVQKLSRMGVSASSVLYIGNDMLKDIYPARNAGFNTALFAGDKRSLRLRQDDPRCANISADLVVTDLLQLLDHFDKEMWK